MLRSTGGQSILKELSNELVAVDIDDAVRLNASALAVQVYIGGVHEHESIGNLVEIVDAGNRHGIPTLAVTGVGKELVRDAKYLGLATRICAEMGAHFVKTYYCEKAFARVAAGCPVPLVIAGGKKLPEPDALKMAYEAIERRRRRRGHGPQYLPVRSADGHDPGGARRGARAGETRRRPTSFIFR